MNSIDTSGKMKFTMPIANNDSVLELLDLSLYINEHHKICVDVYTKPNNSFTCFTIHLLSQKTNKVLKVPLSLRRISAPDKKIDIRSSEHQNYLIARDYNPTLVRKKNSFTLFEI